MCEMLEGALTRRGFEVVSRTSAEEALRLLDTQDFDVIVTDLNMQGTSGPAAPAGRRHPADLPVLPTVFVEPQDGSWSAPFARARIDRDEAVEMEDIAMTLERAVAQR